MKLIPTKHKITCECGACRHLANYTVLFDRVGLGKSLHICNQCATALSNQLLHHLTQPTPTPNDIKENTVPTPVRPNNHNENPQTPNPVQKPLQKNPPPTQEPTQSPISPPPTITSKPTNHSTPPTTPKPPITPTPPTTKPPLTRTTYRPNTQR